MEPRPRQQKRYSVPQFHPQFSYTWRYHSNPFPSPSPHTPFATSPLSPFKSFKGFASTALHQSR